MIGIGVLITWKDTLWVIKGEDEDGAVQTMLKKQVSALHNTLISFFGGVTSNSGTISSSMVFGGCQICKVDDHLAITYPKLNEPRSKSAKCGMFH